MNTKSDAAVYALQTRERSTKDALLDELAECRKYNRALYTALQSAEDRQATMQTQLVHFLDEINEKARTIASMRKALVLIAASSLLSIGTWCFVLLLGVQ